MTFLPIFYAVISTAVTSSFLCIFSIMSYKQLCPKNLLHLFTQVLCTKCKVFKLGKWKWDFLLFVKNGVILIFSLSQLILIFSLIFSLSTMRNTGTALPLLMDNALQQKEKLDREILDNLYNSCRPQVFSIFLLISPLHFCVFLSVFPAHTHTHTQQLSHCNKQIWEFPKTINSLFWKILN